MRENKIKKLEYLFRRLVKLKKIEDKLIKSEVLGKAMASFQRTRIIKDLQEISEIIKSDRTIDVSQLIIDNSLDVLDSLELGKAIVEGKV